jgi:hypothetical protein
LTGPATISRLLLVHGCVSIAVALLLLAMAQPVSWSTQANLEAQDWPFLFVVVVALGLVLGTLQGVLLGVGQRVGGWVAAALAVTVGASGASFYVQAPFAYGDEVWTASREDVVMSQLVWIGYWIAHTVVTAGVVAALRSHGRRIGDRPHDPALTSP